MKLSTSVKAPVDALIQAKELELNKLKELQTAI